MPRKKLTFDRVYSIDTGLTAKDSIEVSRAVDMVEGVIYTYSPRGAVQMTFTDGPVKVETLDEAAQ